MCAWCVCLTASKQSKILLIELKKEAAAAAVWGDIEREMQEIGCNLENDAARFSGKSTLLGASTKKFTMLPLLAHDVSVT
jgi:hypothetical protein